MTVPAMPNTSNGNPRSKRNFDEPFRFLMIVLKDLFFWLTVLMLFGSFLAFAVMTHFNGAAAVAILTLSVAGFSFPVALGAAAGTASCFRYLTRLLPFAGTALLLWTVWRPLIGNDSMEMGERMLLQALAIIDSIACPIPVSAPPA